MEVGLAKICGKDDIVTSITPKYESIRKKGGYGARNIYIPFNKYNRLDWAELLIMFHRSFFYGHMTADQIRSYIEPDIWNNYYKFCFERNPFDKVVSHYYQREKPKGVSFKDFVHSERFDQITGFEMYSKGGNILVDKIYKYENLESSLHEISERIGCKIELPEIRVKGGFRKERKHYSEEIEDPERKKIEIYFARELKLLGYRFEKE